jgi:hypothetical protein
LLIVCFCFFFGLCVYLCSHLPCTFDGWVPFLIFIYKVFLVLNTCAKEVTCGGERESHKIESKKAFVLEFLSFHLVKKDWKMMSLFSLLLVLCFSGVFTFVMLKKSGHVVCLAVGTFCF